jgi:hypothetical protein
MPSAWQLAAARSAQSYGSSPDLGQIDQFIVELTSQEAQPAPQLCPLEVEPRP